MMGLPFSQGPAGARGPSGPPGKAGEDVSILHLSISKTPFKYSCLKERISRFKLSTLSKAENA